VDNHERAKRAEQAVIAYDGSDEAWERNAPQAVVVVGDLLCDLHHLCDELGVRWLAALANGDRHYRDEKEEPTM
jgi:hypothetical protein